MYVIRPALRASTARPPARFIRGRRYPSIPRLRGFHTTRLLAQAANPPPGPNNTPISGNDANKPDAEKAAAAGEDADAVATEDSELLAQKLQRSRETSRRYSAALRRQQRSKKTQGLPPVHVPDWFLKKRVIRREDLPSDRKPQARSAALSVSVSHEESGEQATCSIPASRDLDAAQVLSQLMRASWGRRLDDHEKRKIEKYIDERIASTEKGKPGTSSEVDVDATAASTSTANNPTPASTVGPDLSAMESTINAFLSDPGVLQSSTGAYSLTTRELTELKKLGRKLEEIRLDVSQSPQQRLEASKAQEARLDRWIKKTIAAKARRDVVSKRLSALVLAEIRATVAASLSALRPSIIDSFPSAKTNIILHSPAAEHEKLVDACIHEIAEDLGSDIITLKAQDLAQLGGDYLGEGPEPTPHSIRSLGYETYRLSAELRTAEDEAREISTADNLREMFSASDSFFAMMPSSLVALGSGRLGAKPKVASAQFDAGANTTSDDSGRTQSQNEIMLEDLKLATLLDMLLDASETKQSRDLIDTEEPPKLPHELDLIVKANRAPAFFDYSMGSEGTGLELNSALPAHASLSMKMLVNIQPSSERARAPKRSKIIYVKDFKELNATSYGGRIVQKLEEVVRKRRLAGESIMIVGCTCSRDLTPELSASGVRGLQSEGESSFFRTIVVETESDSSHSSLEEAFAASKGDTKTANLSLVEKSKFRSINLSHIRNMLESLDPVAAANVADKEKGPQFFRGWSSIFPESYMERVLTYDEVHRIALTALGLHVTAPTGNLGNLGDQERTNTQLNWAHVALAMGLLRASDIAKYASFDKAGENKKALNLLQRLGGESDSKTKAKRQQDEKSLQRERELQQIGSSATKHEKRLMSGIADPDQINTTFDQVHVPPDTIDSIRTITSLSLLRPDAFNYGILATEKISGALLYGPPGTGKTLLAKAVAKESGSRVLEVSGSQISDKYVGEGEKNVAAIFSLARKLSPCIVFLDEADAVFASRDSSSDRASHRDILNQFLKEWDGLNDLSVFVMVATNRPFDLDDAVIRRLPRRLLVDLPTQADRKEILRIHLSGEQLDESVDLEDLAKRTPFYSGSDLKNIAVSAALACVKEENEQAASNAAKTTLEIASLTTSESASTTDSSSPSSTPTDASASASAPPTPPKPLHLVRGQTYNFPEKRILHARHFDKALQEISASISEDMSSLNAIKKFDEQYGDRKGNKRKKDFGFGVLTERNESAARVRV